MSTQTQPKQSMIQGMTPATPIPASSSTTIMPAQELSQTSPQRQSQTQSQKNQEGPQGQDGQEGKDPNYQQCVRCVMDTTDPEIHFNKDGVCSHCQEFDRYANTIWSPDQKGAALLESMAAKIRAYGKNKEYDCIVGMSGGVDSSYLLYLAVRVMKLRPLAVHVDAGWNSELAVRNIENLCKGLNVELFTHVVDWEEMRDLQLAYLKSGVPNQDVPQDHIFFSRLYEFAIKNDIKYVLSGANHATESVLPKAWGYNAADCRQIKAIHKLFGTRPLEQFLMTGLFKTYLYYPYVKRMKLVRPLDLINYNKAEGIEFLANEFDWVYYGGKHFESRWTRFFQSYYLPKKFGYDKRLAHLSSLILSGQTTREDALKELAKLPYNESTLANDLEYIAKKLWISVEELEAFVAAPNRRHEDYPSNMAFEEFLRFVKRSLQKLGIRL